MVADKKALNLNEVLKTVDGQNKLKMRDGSDMTVGKLLMEMLGGAMKMPQIENVDMLEAWDFAKSLRGKKSVEWSVGDTEKVEKIIKAVTGLIYCSAEMQGQLLSVLRDYKVTLAGK